MIFEIALILAVILEFKFICELPKELFDNFFIPRFFFILYRNEIKVKDKALIKTVLYLCIYQKFQDNLIIYLFRNTKEWKIRILLLYLIGQHTENLNIEKHFFF